jgi:2',3'-cyclic-nucleotide 2'-phosphodiesterase/3'-nucleotidase/5'-nucleotidase
MVCLLMYFGNPGSSSADSEKDINLSFLGVYASGVFNNSGSEIAAYDPKTARLFITNVQARTIDVVSIADPAAPALLTSVSMAPFGAFANSVAIHKGLVAVAVEATPKTANGRVVFLDADGTVLTSLVVGALPDMITFTPDGKRVLVANEGEPSGFGPGFTDPEGTVSIIDVSQGAAAITQASVVSAGFSAFNGAVLDSSIRIFGPGATIAQDLEPEYITVADDSRTAWVTLQENNAIGELDIANGVFTRLIGLGFKDHSVPGAGLDGSDRDGPGTGASSLGAINIANWPVLGMYLPDAIASYRIKGETFLVTANEGDAREWPGLVEEVRVSALTLNPTVFPNGDALKNEDAIGRLTVTSAGANTDGNATNGVERLLVLGGRSFSIWKPDGTQVFDSGDAFERITAQALASQFNSSHDSNSSFDTRSDNKGPEPEGVTVEKIWGRWYAFIALERIGGVMVYDVTDPAEGRFLQYINRRDFSGSPASGTAGDLGAEGVFVIPESDSPTQQPLLVVTNEVSGTTTIFAVSKTK